MLLPDICHDFKQHEDKPNSPRQQTGVLLSGAHVGRSENLALSLDGDLVARTDPLVSLGDKDRKDGDLVNYLMGTSMSKIQDSS